MRVMELHAPLKVVQRSQGRTATAAAAYRAAERIECERTGQVHDYTKRQRGVEGTALVSADDAPAWTRDRAALWNAAEMREKHPRAQTAREIEVGFPVEFSAAQRREAGLAIGKVLVSRYGSATDVCWHIPSRKGDQRNHHAHILFTGRPVSADGWAKTKRLPLDDREQGPEELKSLRAAVAGVLNDIAARDRLDVYVEHQSFEARGLNREATQHVGPDATEMERRGEATAIGDKNRAIASRNEERERLQDEHDNVIDFDGARLKFRRRNAWELYYRDAQTRRSALRAELDRRFSADEQASRAQLDALQKARASRHLIGRLWSQVTGVDRDEKARLAKLKSGLETITLQRQQAQERFDLEQRERLEMLKADMVQADRAQRERFESFLHRQAEASAPLRAASAKERQQEKQNIGGETNQDIASGETSASQERIDERARRLAEKAERARERGPNRGRG